MRSRSTHTPLFYSAAALTIAARYQWRPFVFFLRKGYEVIMTASDTKVLQVTNISPSVTMEQLENLFSFLGPVDEMQVFPKTNTIPVGSKVAFIRYQSTSPVATGQHLSNTVFIDKAIICVAYNEGKIPDESVALQYVAPATSDTDSSGHQIPGNVDPNKVEEIKRTIYVGNLDSKTATAEQLLTFFTTCGEVRFVRMAGDETQPTRFAFVEFAETNSVQNALQLNGMLFGDRPIKVNHSNNAIVKPQGKTQETNAKEIEEAMRRVREAQSLISRALEPEVKEKKRRTRSRSPRRRRRSRSGSRKRRSGSRSRRRRRSRSRSGGRSRSRRSRSRSSHRRRHRRSRSRSNKRSRSRKKERSSSRKRERKEKSKSRSPGKKSSRHKKDRKRDKDRDRDRDGKKRRKRSRSRSKSKDKPEKDGAESEKKTEEASQEQSTEEIKNDSASPVKPQEPMNIDNGIKHESAVVNGNGST